MSEINRMTGQNQTQREITHDDIVNYYDGFVEHLKHDHERENPRHAKVKADLAKLVKPGMHVLDVGCGTGITSKYMAELGAIVTGIDISSKMIDFAREHSAHVNVTYELCSISSEFCILDSDEYDFIAMIDCLEHLPKTSNTAGGPNRRQIASYNIQLMHPQDIFINIPHWEYQLWLKNNEPERQQIVDEAVTIDDIKELFRFSHIVSSIDIYGIDTPCQYASVTLSRRSVIEAEWRRLFSL